MKNKPILQYNEYETWFECPKCGVTICEANDNLPKNEFGEIINYCYGCGKKLDWKGIKKWN